MTDGWSGVDPAQWAARQKQNLVEVPRKCVAAMATQMARTTDQGGHTPIDQGDLSRSTTISTSGPLSHGEAKEIYARQDFATAASLLKPDGEAWIQYRAIYAARVNYGFTGQDSLGRNFNQSGRGYLEANIAKWPAVVAGVVARVK